MLGKDFNPYSKSQQLKSHQKMKDTPKLRVKKPRQKRKSETIKGRVIPSKKVRGKISKTDYNLAVELHGDTCYFCGSGYNLEMHHVVPKGFSRHKNGRGIFRNLRLLCCDCHRGENGVHRNKEKMLELQAEHERLYGPRFYQDRFDLFKEGQIPNTTKKAYENYMLKEVERIEKVRAAENS
jgi:5-methylcytosine-specific restriction endonuclease McrA